MIRLCVFLISFLLLSSGYGKKISRYFFTAVLEENTIKLRIKTDATEKLYISEVIYDADAFELMEVKHGSKILKFEKFKGRIYLNDKIPLARKVNDSILLVLVLKPLMNYPKSFIKLKILDERGRVLDTDRWSKGQFILSKGSDHVKYHSRALDKTVSVAANTTLVVSKPLNLSGTYSFSMGDGASVIFEESITMTNSSTIIFSGKKWKSVVFKNSSNIVLNNIQISGAHGGISDLMFLDCSLCLLNVNAKITGLKMFGTSAEDLVSVRGSKVTFLKSEFRNASFDLLDSDYSEVHIEKCIFRNSKGDAVDFSHSKFAILDSHISLAQDKGISIGEESQGKVINTQILKNKIGIANKDDSIFHGERNVYKGNWIDLVEYKKKKFYKSKGNSI